MNTSLTYIAQFWDFLKSRHGIIMRSGLRGNEKVIDARRISLINFISLISVICLGSFGIYLLFINIPYASVICFAGSFCNLVAFILTARHKHNSAYLVMCLGNLVLYNTLTLLYGRHSGGYFLLILWLISIITLSKRKKAYSFMFLAGGVSFLATEYYTYNYEPLIHVPHNFQYAYYVIVSLGLSFIYEIVRFFISVQLGFQKELEVKNAELNRYITELKKAESALKLSEIKLAKLLETQTVKNRMLSNQLHYIYNNSINAVAFFEIEGETIRFLSCNKLWANTIGCETDYAEGKDINLLLDKETANLYRKFIGKALSSEAAVQEYIHYRSMYLYIIVTPIIDEQTGKYSSCASFVYNVSDKFEAEKKLKESEEKFFTIFNNSRDAMALLTTDFKVIEANQRIGTLLGYSPRKTDYSTPPIEFDNYLPSKYHSLIWKRLRIIMNGENVPPLECEIQHANGTLVPVEMESSIITLNNLPHILCIFRDISLQKGLERKLTQIGIQVETSERRKLATDLHDNVGPLLSSLNMCISLLARKPEMHVHIGDITDIRRILKEAIVAVREISNNISPQILNSYGLASALDVFFETKKKLINIEFKHNIPDFRFSEIKEVMIYNIVKEVFNNSVKYSKATLIQLNIRLDDNIITFFYKDNGIGFNLEEKLAEAGNSMGLFSLINRIRNLNGQHSLKTAPGDGFSLEITFSINERDFT